MPVMTAYTLKDRTGGIHTVVAVSEEDARVQVMERRWGKKGFSGLHLDKWIGHGLELVSVQPVIPVSTRVKPSKTIK